jgi:hypothetical protein
MIAATIPDRRDFRLLATRLGTYPIVLTASNTRVRVASATRAGSRRTRETVMIETSASRATSAILEGARAALSAGSPRFVWRLPLIDMDIC